MEKTLSEDHLGQFYGSEVFYKHGLMRNIKYTEGVQYVAEKGGAYWLIDKVATLQLDSRVRREEFQAWTLKVSENKSAVLECDDGNGRIVYEETISWTDFPLDQMKFYFSNNVIMLPSEY